MFCCYSFSLTSADQELSVPLVVNEVKLCGKPVFFAGDMNSEPYSKVQKNCANILGF